VVDADAAFQQATKPEPCYAAPMTRPDSCRSATVIGAGPAGLMAATRLAAAGWYVTVFDRMPTPARKLLIAGNGGLNLTHSEPLDRLLDRYGGARDMLADAVRGFPSGALRDWCHALGQPTFVGSSGRVFPVAFKAAPLLRAWLRQLGGAGVMLRGRHRWTGWDAEGGLGFDTPEGAVVWPRADATVLALGGASWPRLGSDGAWAAILAAAGVAVAPLRPSNCGVAVAWSERFRGRFEGVPLKRLALRHGDATARGEAVVTAAGLEGGAVYALSGGLRDAVGRDGHAVLHVDLRPDLDAPALAGRLAAPRRAQSLSTFLRKQAALPPAAIALLHEAGLHEPEPRGAGSPGAASPGPGLMAAGLTALGPAGLAARIKSLPLRVVGVASIERAISSAGGVALHEVDADFMLRRRPGTFVAGEMLDWEAPTGGYLLQAAFSTGHAAAEGVLRAAACPGRGGDSGSAWVDG
jgi:uncharacterized flavoprotein (TIGR03862 family)